MCASTSKIQKYSELKSNTKIKINSEQHINYEKADPYKNALKSILFIFFLKNGSELEENTTAGNPFQISMAR